ncbi:MAG: hypothetical protein K2X87_34965, partial [Gemmataceae bacterium]|nr:hypothetical protein [Gemmataceae bacterium]
MTARGAVNARLEAVLRVRVRGPTGTEAVVDAVIDTGYSGLFTLPAATAVALGLVRRSGGQATLADGSIRQFDVFAAELEWDGGWRGVDVYALGDEVLAGMRLLAGHGLWVEVADGGTGM